jgi:hypothetical protein
MESEFSPDMLAQLFPSLRMSEANRAHGGARQSDDEGGSGDDAPDVDHAAAAAQVPSASAGARRRSSSGDMALPEDWSAWSDTVERGRVDDDAPKPPAQILPAYRSALDASLVLRVAVSQAQGIGFQLWPAAAVMCRWLESQTEYPRDFLRGRRVLELGAGCGLVGMLAASDVLGAASVTITDLDEVVPHIQTNIDANIGAHLAAERVVAAALGAVHVIWVLASSIHHSFTSFTDASCIPCFVSCTPQHGAARRNGRPSIRPAHMISFCSATACTTSTCLSR